MKYVFVYMCHTEIEYVRACIGMCVCVRAYVYVIFVCERVHCIMCAKEKKNASKQHRSLTTAFTYTQVPTTTIMITPMVNLDPAGK